MNFICFSNFPIRKISVAHLFKFEQVIIIRINFSINFQQMSLIYIDLRMVSNIKKRTGGIQLLRSHKMTLVWIPLSHFSHLVDFGYPPFCKRSKLYITPHNHTAPPHSPPPPTHTHTHYHHHHCPSVIKTVVKLSYFIDS